MLWIDERLRPHIPDGGEFEFVLGREGDVFRAQKNRRMIRTQIGGQMCFVKTHGPTSWREIIKNAARGRWPVLTAEPEWKAIRRVRELGILTVEPLGFGLRGRFPDQLESFIITAELAGFIPLSDLPSMIATLPRRQRVLLARTLTSDLAKTARRLHANGLNHRDFYLNHFMLPQRDWRAWQPGEDLRVHLIDLHRMQIRSRTPRKWIIKDISGLLFSAFDADLTSRDYLRFLREYWQVCSPATGSNPQRRAACNDAAWRKHWRSLRLWRWRVMKRAVSLYRSERGRPPRLPAALASFA